jgi:hypothetical protein
MPGDAFGSGFGWSMVATQREMSGVETGPWGRDAEGLFLVLMLEPQTNAGVRMAARRETAAAVQWVHEWGWEGGRHRCHAM